MFQQADDPETLNIGIDFVLFLEKCCPSANQGNAQEGNTSDTISANHTASDHADPAPYSVFFESSQTAFAEVELLLELSSQLNLFGDITPVQAWARIRSHPRFEKVGRHELESLKEAMMAHMHSSG